MMTTALDIKTEDIDQYVKVARERTQAYLTAEELAQRQQMVENARQIATMLKTDYGADEVYLIGSLAHGAWFSEGTDIDLVVKGLDDYWRALAAMEESSLCHKIDLIDWEMATASMRQTVAEDGIAL